jgi:subtilase family serine protease
MEVGGTSESAPLIAAMDALIGPAAASPSFVYAHEASYYDITSGSNGSRSGSPGTRTPSA